MGNKNSGGQEEEGMAKHEWEAIQVSIGQPQWSGPEKGKDGVWKSCRSQAHHGCSPVLLHVWLPIASILLLPTLPLCLYMVVFPVTAIERERERMREGGRERGKEQKREREKEVNPRGELREDRR